MQQPKPLGHNFRAKPIDAGRVAARPGETGDETQLDRVFGDAEYDWDRRSCSFGRLGTNSGGSRGNYGHATADEVRHERWQAIVLAIQPVGLHRHVLVLEVADFI